MKKTLISVLCFLIAILLIGCGTKETKDIITEEKDDAQITVDTGQTEVNVKLSPDDAETVAESPAQPEDDIKADIVMTVKEGEYNGKTASFVLQNTSDKEYTYGADYALEEMIDDEWREIVLDPPLTWNLLAYRLEADSVKEFTVDWSFGYGELPDGTYRLRKSLCDEDGNQSLVYAEFSITSVSESPVAPADNGTEEAPWEISPGDPLAPEGFRKP